MNIKWLNLNIYNTPLKKKTIDWYAIDSVELLYNGRYYSPAISHSIWYVTTRDSNMEMMISLRTIIYSDISVGKIKFI